MPEGILHEGCGAVHVNVKKRSNVGYFEAAMSVVSRHESHGFTTSR